MTGKAISHSRLTVVLVSGIAKAEVAARVIQRQDGAEKLPAARIRPENGRLVWLLDQPAASRLK